MVHRGLGQGSNTLTRDRDGKKLPQISKIMKFTKNKIVSSQVWRVYLLAFALTGSLVSGALLTCLPKTSS